MRHRYSARQIINAVLQVERADLNRVMSPLRTNDVLRVRWLCTVVAKDFSDMSFPEIATALGRKNHSSTHEMYRRKPPMPESEQRAALIAIGATLARLYPLGAIASNGQPIPEPTKVWFSPACRVALPDAADASVPAVDESLLGPQPAQGDADQH